jgi:hypothetical protein
MRGSFLATIRSGDKNLHNSVTMTAGDADSSP